MPWDDDLDISITDDYLEKLLKNKWKIWLLGYRTRIRYFKETIGDYKVGDVRIIKIQTRKWLFFRDKGILDIFILKKEGEEYTYVIGEKPQVQKAQPLKFHEKSTLISFEGKEYSAPENYEDYLQHVYGDWQTPVKDWDFRWGGNCEVKIVK